MTQSQLKSEAVFAASMMFLHGVPPSKQDNYHPEKIIMTRLKITNVLIGNTSSFIFFYRGMKAAWPVTTQRFVCYHKECLHSAEYALPLWLFYNLSWCWNGCWSLNERAHCAWMRWQTKLMLYLLDLFLVVQLFRMSFCQRFAVSLEVNGVWSRFRIFINLFAQIHPWASLLCPD